MFGLIGFLACLFLFGFSILTGISTALQTLGRLQARAEFQKRPRLFFFQQSARALFSGKNWDGLFFCVSFTKQALQLLYALAAFLFLVEIEQFHLAMSTAAVGTERIDGLSVLAIASITMLLALTLDLCVRLIASRQPALFLSLFGWPASCFLLLLYPLAYVSMQALKRLFPRTYAARDAFVNTKIRDKILEIIYESELSPHLDPHEQRLIASVASFKERIAREIMVPRIDMFTLPVETTMRGAAEAFVAEGYSRIPIFRDSVDHIVGVLLYKDVLNFYAKGVLEAQKWEALMTMVGPYVKPVLYTPETKKISHLLQEFRSKQIHLAIVVDEYGGTEGIVTIEDILEELVGEIADEHDVDQGLLYTALPEGWAVDAKMGVIDIEKELGVRIPSSPEYDTIGGYVFHCAGAIPAKGWKLHHDDFDLEVLGSDERSIEKVMITPHQEA